VASTIRIGIAVKMRSAEVHACSVQDSYIYGFALQEKGFALQEKGFALQEKGFALQRNSLPADEESSAKMMLQQLPANDYPYIAETVGGYVTGSGYDFADEFEFGLGLILDGLERLRGTA
jgi:Tetracyclin repressor-like, C-terminal domain